MGLWIRFLDLLSTLGHSFVGILFLMCVRNHCRDRFSLAFHGKPLCCLLCHLSSLLLLREEVLPGAGSHRALLFQEGRGTFYGLEDGFVDGSLCGKHTLSVDLCLQRESLPYIRRVFPRLSRSTGAGGRSGQPFELSEVQEHLLRKQP